MEERFALERFVSAQEGVYERALRELERGRKTSHWMWFIFPQAEGLGRSAASRHYAIRSLEEAAAYLAHPVLGPRLLRCCQALLQGQGQGKSASDIFGFPDDVKLRSSMTLFAQVDGAPPEFLAVLGRYFGGECDPQTLEILSAGR